MKIRLASPLQYDSIVDGEGIRMVLWTQGCSHNCEGCHNKETHSFSGGFLKDVEVLKEEILTAKNHDGITLSGGDPFFQVEPSLEVAKFCKQNNLDVWCYTGFTFEQLMTMDNPKIKEFLKYIDILVDGPFILSEKSLTLKFRGSKNQRIINVKESLKKNKAVSIRKYNSNNKAKNKKPLFV
jgi:anaerobic ribonucleoside-triphosphate reductase activating protein